MFKKNTMSLALAAAMIGGVAMTQQATAIPQMPTAATVAAAAAAGAGSAPYVSVNGLGQALVYPYYTVREGFRTTINVFNTSETHAVAVKVRFREYQNSRDVLDFNLVLSPNDKWSGTVNENSTTGAVLTTGDTSCTIPGIGSGAPFSTSGYSGSFKDSGDAGIERLKSGYVEIIPMAWTNVVTDPVYAGALHVQPAGVPNGCRTVVDNAFAPTAPAWNFAAAPMAGVQLDGAPLITTYQHDVTVNGAIIKEDNWVAIPDGMNPLFGELGIFNKDGGLAGGTNAIAIADWMEPNTPLLTAQEFPYYLEPTLATATGLWDTASIGLTDAALTSSKVINEWANNASNGADVDWVVTMPTKSFHVDVAAANIQAGSSNYRTTGNDGATTTLLAPFEKVFALGASESTVTLNEMYNNEEGHPGASSGTVNFSPGSFTTTNPTLKYEANVITFCGADVAACNGEDVLKSGVNVAGNSVALRLDPVNDVPGAKSNGYMELGIPGAVVGPNNTPLGLPMVGFAIKSRTLGDATKAFGQLFDHKWK